MWLKNPFIISPKMEVCRKQNSVQCSRDSENACETLFSVDSRTRSSGRCGVEKDTTKQKQEDVEWVGFRRDRGISRHQSSHPYHLLFQGQQSRYVHFTESKRADSTRIRSAPRNALSTSRKGIS